MGRATNDITSPEKENQLNENTEKTGVPVEHLNQQAEQLEKEGRDQMKMAMLSPIQSPEKQKEGLELLKKYLKSITQKLKEKGAFLGGALENPRALEDLASEHSIALNEAEQTALYNFNRLLEAGGATTDYLGSPDFLQAIIGHVESGQKPTPEPEVPPSEAAGEKPDQPTADEIKQLTQIIKEGGEISDKLRDRFLEAGGRWPEILKNAEKKAKEKRKELGIEAEGVESEEEKVDLGDEEVGTLENPIELNENAVEKAGHYMTVSLALMSPYQLEGPEFNPMMEQINTAFMLCPDVKVQRVVLAYEMAKNKGKNHISFEHMGINSSPDTSPEALFLMAKLVHGAHEYYTKHKGYPSEKTTVSDFFNELSQDPSLGLMSGVQEAVKQKIKHLNIDSIALLTAGDKIFSREVIDEALDAQKEASIKHLAERYGIKLEAFSDTEKTQFLLAITKLYTNSSQKLNVGSDVIQSSISEMEGSASVKKAIILFWERLKGEAQPVLENCIKRYDIIRTDKESHDQVLKNNLTFDKLHFEDGLKLVLLAEGVDFETKADSSNGMEQGKEVVMLFLIAGILEKRDKGAHAKYASNLLDIARRKTGVDFNVNLEPIRPYLNKIFEVGIRKIKEEGSYIKTFLEGISIEKDPEILAQMEAGEFTLELMTAGGGVIRFPAELYLAMSGEYGKLGSAEDALEAVSALGGTTTFTEYAGRTIGVASVLGKFYFIEPAQIPIDTLYAASQENLGTGVKAYMVGTAPFVVFGAARGLYQARNAQVGRIRSILMSTARGFVPTIDMPITGYRHLRGAKRGIDHALNYARFGSGNAQNLMRSAELFLEYSDKADNTSGDVSKLKAAVAQRLRGVKYQVQRTVYKDAYEAARIRWAKRFAIDYNEFFGVNANYDRSIKPGPKELPDKYENHTKPLSYKGEVKFEDMKSTAESMQKSLRNLAEMHDLDQLSKDEFLKRLREKSIFSDDQIKALEKRMRDPKDGLKGVKRSIRSLVERNTVGVSKPYIASPGEKFSTPKHLGEANYRYKGEKFIISKADIEARMSADGLSKEETLKVLCEEQWSQPRPLKTTQAGTLYKFRGGKFMLSSEEAAKSTAEITKLIEEKYISQMKIEDIRMVEKVKEFKIGGRWIRVESTDDALLTAKQSYLEAAKKAGIPLQHFETTSPRLNKLISYYPALEKMMGPTVAAGMIYHIHSSPDKRKAFAEVAAGYGSFMAGYKGLEMGINAVRSAPKSWPVSVAAFFGGMLAAYEITDPIAKIVEEHFPHWRGDQEMLGETNEILTGMTIHSVIKKIGPFVSKKLGTRIAASIGAKGGLAAFALTNDASIIGFIDDALLAVWVSKDIYDISKIYLKSKAIEKALNTFKHYPEYTVEPIGGPSKDTWNDAMEKLNVPFSSLNEKEMHAFLESLGDVTLRFHHKGVKGFDQYRYVQGEVVETLIQTPEGEMLKLTDQELNQEIALPLPQEFDKSRLTIDYKSDKPEVLRAKYRSAIVLVKSETDWTKLKYDKEKITENSFDLMRHDGTAMTHLEREGDKWKLIDKKTGEPFASGLDIFQAIVLANLKNKIEQVIDKENHTGGTSRPFHLDGQQIQFDRSWNPTDLNILSLKGVDFYGKMEVSPRDIVNALNEWYQNRV